MNKAIVTSPEAMTHEQVEKDVSMTPLERLELAFQLSDFALSFHRELETVEEPPFSIQWIELNKIRSHE